MADISQIVLPDGTTYDIKDAVAREKTFRGASSSAAGEKGLVPAPAPGQQELYLRGDGTWAVAAGDIGDSLVNPTRLSVAATIDGANGYIPVYLDVNGKLCIPITGWYAISSLVSNNSNES